MFGGLRGHERRKWTRRLYFFFAYTLVGISPSVWLLLPPLTAATPTSYFSYLLTYFNLTRTISEVHQPISDDKLIKDCNIASDGVPPGVVLSTAIDF